MICLFRHGEIQGADIKRFIGRTDVALSPVGREQARYWQRYFTDTHWDRVFASPLSRAVETAAVIARKPLAEIQHLEDLAEINLGRWEGIPFSTIKEKQPEQWQARGADLAGYRPQSGESFSDLARRAVPAFRRLIAASSGNVLVVAHAGVNRVILADLLGYDLSRLFSIPQAYGCLNRLEKINGGVNIHKINQVPGNFSW